MCYNLIGDYMRLDKYLANLKYGTRKDVSKLVRTGVVTVNGETVKNASININDSDVVTVFEEEVFYKQIVTIMLNKPSGVVCANRDSMHQTVIDLLEEKYQRFDFGIAGRLDIDTEGLVLLTTDGDLLHKIITPKKNVMKKYYVELRDKLENYEILETGVEIMDGKNNPFMTKDAVVEKLSDNSCYISISEGKYHQVKRMFLYIGNEVTYLKRIAIGNLELDNELENGDYKEIALSIDDLL